LDSKLIGNVANDDATSWLEGIMMRIFVESLYVVAHVCVAPRLDPADKQIVKKLYQLNVVQ
jgi:hypothetical protein